MPKFNTGLEWFTAAKHMKMSEDGHSDYTRIYNILIWQLCFKKVFSYKLTNVQFIKQLKNEITAIHNNIFY